MSEPSPHYTHSQHAVACKKAAIERRPLQTFVQVNYHGTPVCGKVLDAWDTHDAQEMWNVDLIGEVKGRMSFPVHKVRQCSGIDGHCHCAKEFTLPSTNG